MKILITGGAGFIGSNTAERYLSQGHQVILLDNLSRPGSEKNLAWIESRHDNLTFVKADVRDASEVKSALAQFGPMDAIIHLAAQVAVTTSVLDPRLDFDVNAIGTFNVLEAVRQLSMDPVLLFTSTNKVYGELTHLEVDEDENSYRYASLDHGVDERTPLDFHSPYGCSKGTADQYVHDYHRIYGLRTIVFRNSCIYGPRQFGIEDQGWVAWFVIAAQRGWPIKIYGDGKQVRDVLFVDDLVDGMQAAVERADVTQGQVYNMGGGKANTLSIWKQFGPMLEKLLGQPIPVTYEDWRPGDQKIFVSDIRKANRDFGWAPKTSAGEGIRQLFEWVKANQALFEE